MRRIASSDAADEAGAISTLALILVVPMLVLAGLGMDMAKLAAARTQLQVTADLAAHAALYVRDEHSAAEARSAAISASEAGMPVSAFGHVLEPSDIVFGTWDPDTQKFTPDPTDVAKDAVFIKTIAAGENHNPILSNLLKFIGFGAFDVRTGSVFTTYSPACFREGFVADGIVDIQSNNSYFNGFCIHSNTYVSVNSNNYWEPGTVVSMPDTSQIDLPQSGFETNSGLQEALREGYYYMRLIRKLPDIIAHLTDWDNEWQPDYVTSIEVQLLPNKSVTPANFLEHHYHTYTCSNVNTGKLTLGAGTYRNMVLVTNCQVEFANGTILEDSIVATSNTTAKSVSGPQGVQIGKDDNCATGGGAQVLTLGGVDVAANLAMFGGQIVAAGSVDFAARADGLQGASIISGGEINGTSNMSMALCGSGMEDNFFANYFRLAI